MRVAEFFSAGLLARLGQRISIKSIPALGRALEL
jgi:hypothetical protein